MTDSMSRTSRFSLLLVLLVSVVGVDQASKQYAMTHWAHWEGQPGQSYLGDLFRITFAKNEGAFLSLFGTLSDSLRYLLLVVGNGIFMAVLVLWLLGTPRIDRWNCVAWALVFVGGVGNLIDRIRFHAVIDFLNLGIGSSFRTGIFNVADMAITVGFVMLVPQIFKSVPEEAVAPLKTSPAPTPPGSPS